MFLDIFPHLLTSVRVARSQQNFPTTQKKDLKRAQMCVRWKRERFFVLFLFLRGETSSLWCARISYLLYVQHAFKKKIKNHHLVQILDNPSRPQSLRYISWNRYGSVHHRHVLVELVITTCKLGIL